MFTSGFWFFCGIVAVASYLLGSLNFGIIVSKLLLKDDVRKHGSGNAGMTNMLRTYGKKPAIITTIGDFTRAVAAIFLARYLFSIGGHPEEYAAYLAALFVLLGHLYPLYFGFKGGKGVITMLGVIFMVNPIVFLIIAIIFIPMAFITRIVSLASITGAVAYPVITCAVLLIQGQPAVFETVCAALTGAIVIIVHRSNIKRLMNGTENRFGSTKK